MTADRQPAILITGCSSGIGYDAAQQIVKRGWRVLATCRQQQDCDRLNAAGLESFTLDYASEASVAAGAEEALERCEGRIDALFNNGAFATPGLVEDLPRDALRHIFETNLFGQFQLINSLLPSMRTHGHGTIINNSSVLGLAAMPFRGAYVASKFAMEGLTDALRLELHEDPIHVVLIEPGPINTLIREKSIPHFERWIDVAASAQRERYERYLLPRLYKPQQKKDKYELPPAAVTEIVWKAINSRAPAPRYYVTKPTWMAGIGKRLLSTRAMDRIVLKRR